MKTLSELKTERSFLTKQCHNILDRSPGRLSAVDKANLHNMEKKLKAIAVDINREESIRDIVLDDHLSSNKDSFDPGQAMFNKFIRNGLSANEWLKVQNTMSTTTPSEGGYSVPANVAREAISAMKDYSSMRSVATVITTETGNDMSYPTSDGTAEIGELIVQNATATDLDISFGIKPLPVYKYSSKVITVPFELLQDSNIDIEAYIKARFSERLGRIQNAYFTTGTGSGQPQGIVTAATSGKVGATGQTATVIYDDLIDLEMSVDAVYRRNAKFMMNDLTLKAIKRLKDTAGAPIWTPSVRTQMALQ